jgi:hypothetical protein
MNLVGCFGVLVGMTIFGPIGMFAISHNLPKEAVIISVGGHWVCLVGLLLAS